MRIGVLRNTQSENDSPKEYISKSHAQKLMRSGTHYKVSTYIIREMVIGSTPVGNPERHAAKLLRHVDEVIAVPVHKLNPPEGPSTLNLFYPVRDMSSYGPRNFKEIWGGSQEEWQRRIGG